ncbi:hypothetical protein AWL63_18100 [Sphingomonas panacis]|uniref:Uncharacterized protein n=1 Tax=Sphingomonas panacis TaxID=1560345 RepID=A0A1B3ZDQ3_9SPHN|nr:hypothetical protein [Sphingomonas panacis]AOH85560.1 hypothetical protein AWL63_18100 [Sphingomonas panacis]
MRLVDELAARRLLYSRSIPTLPDILLIDIPSRFAAPTLPMGRYYPVILETHAEAAEMEQFLQTQRPTEVPPNLFDRRSSALVTEDIIFARYAPLQPDWPWLLLCCWPAAYRAVVHSDSEQFARDQYTSEIFPTLAELQRTENLLLKTLRMRQVVQVRHSPGPHGHA